MTRRTLNNPVYLALVLTASLAYGILLAVIGLHLWAALGGAAAISVLVAFISDPVEASVRRRRGAHRAPKGTTRRPTS
ncbi:hypothetical protein HY68_36600 [Streptomyces sp. AcH 505]|uniref:hypothetical protein n=1 Tax=Streptomyces sp. AcH 505 TaxID=352211 RepID=UPI000591B570|nr:hypothetical protein HY68_36600 [Streptomyces sp. AcH 505]